MQKGTIVIELDPITPEETQRLRQTIMTLIMNGAFNVKNGSVAMHFDGDGLLRELRFDIVKKIKPKEANYDHRQGNGHSQAEAVQPASERGLR